MTLWKWNFRIFIFICTVQTEPKRSFLRFVALCVSRSYCYFCTKDDDGNRSLYGNNELFTMESFLSPIIDRPSHGGHCVSNLAANDGALAVPDSGLALAAGVSSAKVSQRRRQRRLRSQIRSGDDKSIIDFTATTTTTTPTNICAVEAQRVLALDVEAQRTAPCNAEEIAATDHARALTLPSSAPAVAAAAAGGASRAAAQFPATPRWGNSPYRSFEQHGEAVERRHGVLEELRARYYFPNAVRNLKYRARDRAGDRRSREHARTMEANGARARRAQEAAERVLAEIAAWKLAQQRRRAAWEDYFSPERAGGFGGAGSDRYFEQNTLLDDEDSDVDSLVYSEDGACESECDGSDWYFEQNTLLDDNDSDAHSLGYSEDDGKSESEDDGSDWYFGGYAKFDEDHSDTDSLVYSEDGDDCGCTNLDLGDFGLVDNFGSTESFTGAPETSGTDAEINQQQQAVSFCPSWKSSLLRVLRLVGLFLALSSLGPVLFGTTTQVQRYSPIIAAETAPLCTALALRVPDSSKQVANLLLRPSVADAPSRSTRPTTASTTGGSLIVWGALVPRHSALAIRTPDSHKQIRTFQSTSGAGADMNQVALSRRWMQQHTRALSNHQELGSRSTSSSSRLKACIRHLLHWFRLVLLQLMFENCSSSFKTLVIRYLRRDTRRKRRRIWKRKRRRLSIGLRLLIDGSWQRRWRKGLRKQRRRGRPPRCNFLQWWWRWRARATWWYQGWMSAYLLTEHRWLRWRAGRYRSERNQQSSAMGHSWWKRWHRQKRPTHPTELWLRRKATDTDPRVRYIKYHARGIGNFGIFERVRLWHWTSDGQQRCSTHPTVLWLWRKATRFRRR
jgi:hypothetical protein